MKNILFSLLSAGLLLTSCAAEEFEVKDPSEGNLHLSVEIPTGTDMRTRADEHKFSDGTTVNELKCYVYNQAKGANSEPVAVKDVAIVENEETRTGQLSLDLPTGQVYDVVFLATANPQDDSSSKVCYDAASRQLKVNYDKIKSCDEDVDCFYAVQKSISSDQKSEYKLTLRRPFAQLNIGTKDMATYNSMSSSPLKSVGITVDGVYTSMDIMDGSVIGDPSVVTIAPAPLPIGQIYPVSGADYLTMDYLLVDGRTNVNVTLTGANDTNSFDTTYAKIPLQRNYQTNLYGNLLTAENDFSVEINPNYNGLNDKDAEDLYADYDIVLKVPSYFKQNNSYHILSIDILDDNDNYIKNIDLKQFVDKNNIMKVSFEELGISVGQTFRFYTLYEKYTYYYPMVKEVIKIDIDKLHITNIDWMFHNCKYLENIDGLKNWNTKNITSMNNTFSSCTELKKLDAIKHWDVANVTYLSGIFKNCSGLTNLDDLADWNTSNVTNLSSAFSNCSSLTNVDGLKDWNTSNVANLSYAFSCCSSLTNVDGLKDWNTRNVTNMQNIFYGCPAPYPW